MIYNREKREKRKEKRWEISISLSPFWHIIMIALLSLNMTSCGWHQKGGCMDEACDNYDSGAEQDDGSCDCNSAVDFDRAVMLNNYANNIIVPAYTRLSLSLDTLQTVVESGDIQMMRSALQSAYVAWAYCSVFEFGPAENNILRQAVNTFPTDTSLIVSNINSGTYHLAAISNYGAKGFPALDYVLAQGSLTEKSTQYVEDVLEDMKILVDVVLNEWNSTYAASFVTKEGTDVASALGLLVNQFNYEVDLLKGAKVGIPLGKKTFGTAMIDQVEGYFLGQTNVLLLASIRSLKTIFTGGESQGMEDYLDFVNAKYNEDENLSHTILNKLEEVEAAATVLTKPLSQAITEETDQVETLYSRLSELIILTKTDMPSAMSILITYQDNDGD